MDRAVVPSTSFKTFRAVGSTLKVLDPPSSTFNLLQP
jgi:hypothetical protein